MKKLLTALLLGMALLSLAACGGESDAQEEQTQIEIPVTAPAEKEEPKETPTDSTDGTTILVAYFSRIGENYSVGTINEGNTAIIAKFIAEQTGGDLFEIVPMTPYPANYQDTVEIARQEANAHARPLIDGTVANMEDYDAVFIGYPIWHGDMPMIVYTFLESYDFSSKTVIPFNTHEGSGQAGTQSKIAAKVPDATVLNGIAIRGATAQNERAAAQTSVRNWLNGLGYGD